MSNEATPTAKPWWQSKTVWLNVLALASMAVPAVREWVEKNPVDPLAALGALNLLVRFVTSARISIFPDDESGNGSESFAGTSVPGGNTGRQAGSESGMVHRSVFPWLVGPACALLAACTVGVDAEGGWSIRPDPRTVDAGLRYLIRHDEESAKSGLTQWKYYDPATGEEILEEDYADWGITP